jgi:tetratricopeptide (TPR) repeat protein
MLHLFNLLVRPKKLSMKKLLILVTLLYSTQLLAQDAASLMEEGKKLEQKLKEAEAFDKYKQAMEVGPASVSGFVKLAELSLSIGGRQTDPVAKGNYYLGAKSYADAARRLDSTSADGFYILSAVYAKLAEMEEKRDAFVEDVRLTKLYVGRAIAANPNLGKAYNVLGKWHYDMLILNPVKKAALKVLYGSFSPSSIDSSIAYFEKCKTLEPYYCLNFYQLGQAYNYNRQYEKAIDTLKLLSKLPTRRQDDPAIKADGAVLLQKLQ